MSLRVDVHHQLGSFQLTVQLDWRGRGVLALYGRSGAGKSTLLRCIAGLEPDCSGSVQFEGETWQSPTHFVPTHRRPIGMVFQDARLFPHLSVLGNLRYAVQRAAPATPTLTIDTAVELLGLQPLLDRSTEHLSGGQRQRVAIARALLRQPRLLLLDEPLASVDLEGRAEILGHLERLQAALQLPMIYVTHSIQESSRLADDLALIDNGRIEVCGPLAATLVRTDLPLAFQAQAGAIVSGRLESHDTAHHLSLIRVGSALVAVSIREVAVGTAQRLRIDARDVSIALQKPHDSSISNVLPARVLDIHDDRDPAQQLVRLDADGQVLLARITRRSVLQLQLRPELPVYAQVKSVALVD